MPENFKPTDYMLALALAYFVIKELFKLVTKKQDDKDKSSLSEVDKLYRTQIMSQHNSMIERLEDIGTALITISDTTKNTQSLTGHIKDDCTVIKERTK